MMMVGRGSHLEVSVLPAVAAAPGDGRPRVAARSAVDDGQVLGRAAGPGEDPQIKRFSGF